MAEYIERDCLIDMIDERNRNTCNGKMSCLQMKRMVESIPNADVVEVVHCMDCVYYDFEKGCPFRESGYFRDGKPVIDPSAASMIECIRRHGSFSVRAAKNDVIPGIGITGSLLAAGKLKIHADCKDCIREFGIYSWDEKAKGDQVIKENDHAMDDTRYFCYTILRRLFRWDDWKQVDNVS